jgi:hypothetical protein
VIPTPSLLSGTLARSFIPSALPEAWTAQVAEAKAQGDIIIGATDLVQRRRNPTDPSRAQFEVGAPTGVHIGQLSRF